MKFRYVGKKEDMKVFGYDFTDGKTPDVVEDLFIHKLSGNSHFAVVETVAVPVEVKEKKTAAVKADPDSKDAWPV